MSFIIILGIVYVVSMSEVILRKSYIAKHTIEVNWIDLVVFVIVQVINIVRIVVVVVVVIIVNVVSVAVTVLVIVLIHQILWVLNLFIVLNLRSHHFIFLFFIYCYFLK
jgi:hypothetical protein